LTPAFLGHSAQPPHMATDPYTQVSRKESGLPL
jgi:hypothetical protein